MTRFGQIWPVFSYFMLPTLINAGTTNYSQCELNIGCCADLILPTSAEFPNDRPRKTIIGETITGHFHYMNVHQDVVDIRPDQIDLWKLGDSIEKNQRIEPHWYDGYTGFSYVPDGEFLLRLCTTWNGQIGGNLVSDWIRGEKIYSIDIGPI